MLYETHIQWFNSVLCFL